MRLVLAARHEHTLAALRVGDCSAQTFENFLTCCIRYGNECVVCLSEARDGIENKIEARERKVTMGFCQRVRQRLSFLLWLAAVGYADVQELWLDLGNISAFLPADAPLPFDHSRQIAFRRIDRKECWPENGNGISAERFRSP